MFVRKVAGEIRITDLAERSSVNGTLQVSAQLAERCRTNLGWDGLCDKAKVATKEALYWQMKAKGAQKSAISYALEINFPTSGDLQLGREKKKQELEAVRHESKSRGKTIAKQRREIEKLQAQLSDVTARGLEAAAQRDHLLRTKSKLQSERPAVVPFAFANELFSISSDAIEKKGGLFKDMLAGDFASAFDGDGVIQQQWPNLLASDFSLLVAWYEDTLPQFVLIERLERLLPYLDYLDLPACATDLSEVARNYSIGAPTVAEKLGTLELKLAALESNSAALEKKSDIFEGTFQRHYSGDYKNTYATGAYDYFAHKTKWRTEMPYTK